MYGTRPGTTLRKINYVKSSNTDPKYRGFNRKEGVVVNRLRFSRIGFPCGHLTDEDQLLWIKNHSYARKEFNNLTMSNQNLSAFVNSYIYWYDLIHFGFCLIHYHK